MGIILVFAFVSELILLSDRSLYASVLLTIGFALLSPTLWIRFQRWFDHIVYGVKYNPQDIIRVISQRLPNMFELGLITELLRKEVMSSLLIRESALYIAVGVGYSPLYENGINIPTQFMEKKIMEQLLINPVKYQPPRISMQRDLDWVRLTIPLKIGEKIIGIWLFGRRDPDDYYSRSDILLLETIGNQVAPMLENIHLYNEERNRVKHLQSMRDVGIAISSSLDLHFNPGYSTEASNRTNQCGCGKRTSV